MGSICRGLAAVSAILSLFGSVQARAGEQLHVGPQPLWIEPVAEPPASRDGGAVVLRLIDQQARIDAEGTHQFTRQIIRVNAAEGLQAVGTVGGTWQPATDRLTLHKALIHRDGKQIDILKDGKSFTILRRESGLEAAAIDGRLTATMQVPDLRVGDELELAYTLDHYNPLFGNHAEIDALLLGTPRIDRLSIRVTWPTDRNFRWRAGANLPSPKVSHRGATTTLTLARDGFIGPPVPNKAPGRYIDAGRLQLSDYGDWQTFSALVSPLYKRAITLAPDSPLHAEIAKIAAASKDPKVRAEKALTLVQTQVRYFADLNGLGGYSPASADTVWAARVGDCKGKTALLLALLHGLDIAARPALVSVAQGDGVDQSLPMAARFDHVIVAAEIDGKTHWLDGTRLGDNSLDLIAVPKFEWALPLTNPGSELVRLIATPPARPLTEWRLDLDARKGITVPAKATGEGIFRGDPAVSMKAMLTLLDATKRDQFLRNIWADRHDWIEIETLGYRLDDPSGAVHISFTGKAPMDWNLTGPDAQSRYEANKARLGLYLSPDRKALPAPDVPVQIDERYDVTRQTILLPNGGKGFYIDGEPIDQSAGGVRYNRTVALKGERFDVSTSTRSSSGEISVADAKAADKQVDTIFGKQLFIHLPPDDVPAAAKAPKAAGRKGGLPAADAMPTPFGALARQGDYKGALAALDADMAQSGRSAKLLGYRAQLLAALDRSDDANAAADAALAMDAGDEVALRAKMGLLEAEDRKRDALILLDRLILLQPSRTDLYIERAKIRDTLDWVEGALADYDIVFSREIDNPAARAGRITLLLRIGRRAEALLETDTLVRLRPNDAATYALRGNVLAQLGETKEAAAAIARSIAIAPNADAYITRLSFGLSPTPADRLADMLAVIRLAPNRPLPAAALVPAARDPKAYAALHAAYIEAEKRHPASPEVSGERLRLEQEMRQAAP
jgi:tetratricopeptide (TPR) repeat protein